MSGLDIGHNALHLKYHCPGAFPSFILKSTANVTEFAKQTRVRVIFQAKVFDNKGGVLEVKQIDDEQFYKDFFAIVDQGMFLEKEKI